MATLTQTLPARPVSSPASARHWRLSFGGQVKAEFTKLFSLRSTYWLLGLMVAGYAALSVLLFAPSDPATAARGISPTQFLAGTMPGQFLIVVLAALVISGEYSTGQIRSSLAAAPRRTSLLAAKAIVVAVVTVAIALIATLAATIASVPFWGKLGAPQLTGHFWYLLGAALFYLVSVALISLGLGTLIRATPGAITAALGMVLLVPMVLQGFLSSQAWAVTLYTYMPDAQWSQLLRSSFLTAPDGTLSGLQSGLVLIGWIVVVLGAGAVRLRRSDA